MNDYDVLHDLFVNFEERINNNIRKRILHTDYFVESTPRKPWPKNSGRSVTYPIYERAGLPSGFLPFTPITPYGEGSTCEIPTVEAENFAATIKEVTLVQAAQNTPNFCLRDLEFDGPQITRQLEISVSNMSDATRFNWGQELMNRYIELCGNKLILTADAPTNQNWLAVEPTAPLTWGALDYVYQQLRYIVTPGEGGGPDEEGKETMVAVGEYEAFNGLKNQDSNFRGDLLAVTQGGGEGKTLIGSPGMPAGKSYRGWKFVTVQFPARYDLINGQWVQRYPYTAEETSNGSKLEPSELYKNANFTDIVVHFKSVFDHLVPAAPKNQSGYNWDQEVDWMGIHRWVKLPVHKTENPDGAKGFWRSTFAYGPQLQRPDLGWTIRVQRCKVEIGDITCSKPNALSN